MSERVIRDAREGLAAADGRALQACGVSVVREFLRGDALSRLQRAAEKCFELIESGGAVPERYRFNAFSHSLLLAALTDFGCTPAELQAPLSMPGLLQLFSEAMGCECACNMEQSWLRKKFAPDRAPDGHYHPQGWHQDGALNVRFPAEAGSGSPMTALLTCWMALTPCGAQSPGLEFVTRRLDGLLHFTGLEDGKIRRRFAAGEFWAPVLEAGDALIFLNGTLHRTYTTPSMRDDRISLEYRLFPV